MSDNPPSIAETLAREYSIDLKSVTGTGPDGSITGADVLKVALTSTPRAATTSRPQPHTSGPVVHTRAVRSSFARSHGAEVTLDVNGRNPLLEDLQTSNPVTYATAVRNNAGTPPPTIFMAGDLPIFTASGLEPLALLRLPWIARHPAAAEPDRGKVAAMFEACAGAGDDAWNQAQLLGQGHPGNRAYAARMKAWAEAFPEDPSSKSDVGWVSP